nr:albusnodin family lasso peptide [Streptomyces sp. SID8356]
MVPVASHPSPNRRKLVVNTPQDAKDTDENELLPVDTGDATVLTEGQGGGHSEDKRRAYNS